MKSYAQKLALIFAASLGLAGCTTHNETWQPQQPQITDQQKCKWACCKCAHCIKMRHGHKHGHKHHAHKHWNRHCQFDNMNPAEQQGLMAPGATSQGPVKPLNGPASQWVK